MIKNILLADSKYRGSTAQDVEQRSFEKTQPSKKRIKMDKKEMKKGNIDQNQIIADSVCKILDRPGMPTPITEAKLRLFRKNRHVATFFLSSNQRRTDYWKANGEWQKEVYKRKLAFTVCPIVYDAAIPELKSDTLRAVREKLKQEPNTKFCTVSSIFLESIDFHGARRKYGEGYIVYPIRHTYRPYEEHGEQMQSWYSAIIDLILSM